MRCPCTQARKSTQTSAWSHTIHSTLQGPAHICAACHHKCNVHEQLRMRACEAHASRIHAQEHSVTWGGTCIHSLHSLAQVIAVHVWDRTACTSSMMTISNRGPEASSMARSPPAADSVQATTSACRTTACRTSFRACAICSLPFLACASPPGHHAQANQQFSWVCSMGRLLRDHYGCMWVLHLFYPDQIALSSSLVCVCRVCKDGCKPLCWLCMCKSAVSKYQHMAAKSAMPECF